MLAWSFYAVFKDDHRNRFELGATKLLCGWDGDDGAPPDDAELEVAVCGKELMRGVIPFAAWPDKLALFGANLDVLLAFAQFRQDLFKRKRG